MSIDELLLAQEHANRIIEERNKAEKQVMANAKVSRRR